MMLALWIAVTDLRSFAPRVLEGEPRDAPRRARRDHLDAFDDAGRDLMLDAGVEVLGVLAHDDQVDIFETACERPGSSASGACSHTG